MIKTTKYGIESIKYQVVINELQNEFKDIDLIASRPSKKKKKKKKN